MTALSVSPALFSSPAHSPASTPSLSPPQTQPVIPPTSSTQKPLSSFNVKGEILFFARRWRQEADRIIADGEAEVRYQGITLYAEHIEIDTKTKDVLAVGSVVLHVAKRDSSASPPASGAPAPSESPAPDQVINADRLEFNLDTAEGRMEKASGLIQPTLSFKAETVERKAGLDRMGRMSFTTCTQPTPRWKFSSARAEWKPNDYVTMRGAVFSIKGLPVFYWPYLRYPLDETRSTGFLMPELGYSGSKGLFYSQSFFWAIARNQDATFQLDLYSRRGTGGGAEYRYLFDGGTAGALNLFYFKFKPDETGAIPARADAYIVRWNHNQTLPGGFTLAAAVDYQSSFDFLREFDNSFQRATVSNRRSQVFLSKSWTKLSLSVRTSQFETYFPEYGGPQGNSIITRYLPQISLASYKLKLAGPLYVSFAGGFSRWQYGWKTDYDAGRALKTQSAAFAPVLSLPWSALPWLSASFAVGGNFNYYWQTYAVDPNTGGRFIADDPMLAMNYGLTSEIIGPVFYRIFELKSGARIKHLIEPSLAYRFDSPVADRDRIITASGYFLYHQLSYGITNHVYVKDPTPEGELVAAVSGPPPREVLTWGVRQTYYLAPETGPLSYYQVDGLPPRFSEISSYLRFFPAGSYSLDVSASFNPYYSTLSSLRLGASIGLPTDNWFFTVSWFKSINAWLKGAAEAQAGGSQGTGAAYLPFEYSSIWDRHQLNLIGGLKIPRWDIEARGEAAFNFIERKLLYAAGELVYHYQCLDIKAEVRVFYYRDTPETRFNISVGLGNIGRSGGLLN